MHYYMQVLVFLDSRVRSRVNTQFRRMFATLEEAEEKYHLTLSDCLSELVLSKEYRPNKTTNANPQVLHKTNPELNQEPNQPTSTTNSNIYSVDEIMKATNHLNINELLTLTNDLFFKLVLFRGIRSNPTNFCSLALDCMILLQNNQKTNLLYKYALAICNKSPTTGEYVFPMNRMPFGLVEYQIEFFSCTNIKQVL